MPISSEGRNPRKIVFAVDDFQELLKGPREWLADLINLIRAHSGLENIAWVLALDEVSYYLLHKGGGEARAAERRFWNEYGFRGIRSFSAEDHEGTYDVDEHEPPTQKRAGGWLSLDYLNASDQTGIQLLKTLYKKQDPSESVLAKALDLRSAQPDAAAYLILGSRGSFGIFARICRLRQWFLLTTSSSSKNSGNATASSCVPNAANRLRLSMRPSVERPPILRAFPAPI